MTWLDALLLSALVAAGWIWSSPRFDAAARWTVLAIAGALAVVQALVEGCYWQFWSGYAAVAVIAVWRTYRSDRYPSVASRSRLRHLPALLVAALAIGPWLVAPAVPSFPLPSGPYPVGTSIFRWIDRSRLEPATVDPADPRNVVAQVVYPAAPGTGGAHPPYIDGIGNLPESVAGLPAWMMKGYGRIDVHARLGARLSAAKARWPLLLFSPGAGAPRAYYTGLAVNLASRGIIVLVFDHPFESAVTRLADGRVVADAAAFQKIAGDPAREDAFMVAEQDLRAGDMRFGLTRLLAAPAFAAHIRTDEIAAGGHSFGGASGVVAAAQDPRIGAAINIDGTVYGALSGSRLIKPFLLIESDFRASPHGETYREAARRLMTTARPAERHELLGSDHFDFTDAPLFFALPGRMLLGLMLGGGRDTREVHRTTADLIARFLSEDHRSPTS